MFFSTEDDDDVDFTPSSSTGSKLSSLFGGGKAKSSNLKYVPPKQPRSRRGSVSSENSVKGETNKTNGSSGRATPQQSTSAPTAPVVLIAIPVTSFLYMNNSAQPYGRVMCCILGNVQEKKFNILLYRSKQEHLAKAQIHSNFQLTVQVNNYASFADDQQRNWSINVDEANYSELIIQISICKAFCKGSEGTHIVQDLVQGNGAAITQNDSIQVSYTTWSIENCKKGTQDPNGVSSRRIRLSKSGKGWESGLQGACCNGRRLVLSQDGSALVVYDVTIERVKGKGGEASGRSSPVPSIAASKSQDTSQIVNHKQDKPLHSTQTPVNVLQEDTGGGLAPQAGDGESQSRSRRSSLKARMARVGHALLPPQATAHHTDSDSEWEEVSRRQRHLSHSSSIAESVEELSATPALSHSHSLSQEQLAQHQHQMNAHHHPNASARAGNGGPQQPQQVVVYQSMPWQHQQHASVPAIGYATPPPGHQMSAGNSSVHSTPASATSTLTPSGDSTMSLLFSETRSQNTELRISVAKIQDKMDALCSKFDALEMKNHNTAVTRYGGQPSSVSLNGDPHALLEQITSLVTDNDDMKGKIVESEKKIVTLNESINLLLHKNQKLLEEKTEMLVSEQKSQRDNSSTNLTEVISLREEKATITAHLTIAQTQCDKLKSELATSQSKVESLEKKILEIELEVKQSQDQLEKSTKEITEKRIIDMTLEKDQLSSEVEEIGSQMKALQLKLQETHENLVSISQQLEDIKSERDSLKKQLEKSQVELQEHKQLEENAQLKEGDHNKEGIEKLQVRVNELTSDKTKLEHRIEELKSSHSTGGTDPSSSVAMVKKVMNGVFRSLKPKFTDSEVYEGDKVKQIILDVIRDTTLQLIENVQTSQEENKTTNQQKEKQTEESEMVSKDAQPLTDDLKHIHNSKDDNDKELHQTLDVDLGSNSLDEIYDKSMEEGKAMEDLTSVKSNQKEKDVCNGMNISTISLINGNDFDSIGDRDHIVNSDVNNSVNSLSLTTDVTSNKVPDLLSQITEEGGDSQKLSIDSNEIENEIGHKINRLSFNEKKDSFDYDIQSQEPNILTQNQNSEIKLSQNGEQIDSLNVHNSDSVREQIMSQSNKEERSEVLNADVTNKDENSRIPVIDMENTGHRFEKSDIIEKSDSSRDSSLERALRPQPPPPPLFTDEEEDDDDWLS